MVGPGYGGLPLAVGFAAEFEVVGYDRSEKRIGELRKGVDCTHEVEDGALGRTSLVLTDNPDDLKRCTFIVVAVPTPITKAREPDLSPLESVPTTVGRILQPGMLVVYESTVYPGVTEDVVVINGHNEFRGIDLAELRQKMRTPVLIDVRSVFAREAAKAADFEYVSL